MPDILAALFPALVGFCIVSAFITYGLGAYVFAQSPSSAVNRLFLVLTFSATIWALGESLFWNSTDYDNCFLWVKAGSFWIFVVAFMVHFTLAFTDHPLAQEKKRGALLTLLYLPALLFALIGLSTDLIYTVGLLPGAGYVYLPASASPAYLAERAYVLLGLGSAAYVGIVSWQRAPAGRVRSQNRLICIGIATVIGFGVLSGEVLPALGVYIVDLTFIGVVVFSFLIAHAVRRYGLFTLSPQTAVPEIIRTMPDGLILADRNGKIVMANMSAAEVFGVGEADLPGEPVGQFIPPAACAAIGAAVAGRGRFSDLEAAPDGREGMVVSLAGASVRNPDGEPAGFVLIVRDITDRKAAETALRTANQKLSLLSQVTCHDIGNDVTGLAWYLGLLKEDRMHPDGEAYLDRSIRLAENIRKHLEFAREYQMFGVYQPDWQPLEPMIARAAGGIPHPGVEIAVRVAPVEVYADPLSPKVMHNLLENALRHGGGITRLSITTDEQADGALRVVFEDDGAGIRDDEKEKIFRCGYGKNTGFGLAFARDILSVTGITIRETGAAGRGARFEISVPAGTWRPVDGRETGPNPGE
ncbi:PAS domain S-box protein [Methanoculleus sp. Wushi-C6]|uniref:histidine kinase n=1 Tax=Methanoculleus caldifontis TaxID=2651577 RepID=A0ABU3X1C2_9EURY|nr:histidine kinase N-terminal 7TM domain-containing protein [Methanoculleus sp. Wushi-C6]MDV2481853.1 PAS domain S-box protein [Methanoculleus sp. Wushi-C6]